MINKMGSGPVKFSPLYALVRDKSGKPKIEDGELMPEWAQKDLLTLTEIEVLKNDRYAFRPST